MAVASEEAVLLSCVVCHSLATQPMLLPCLHNCCKECVKSITINKKVHTVKCPLCRETLEASKTSTHALKDNLHVAARIALHKSNEAVYNCGICYKRGVLDKTAHQHCLECQKHLCDDCVINHDAFLTNHTVVDLDTYNSSRHKVSLVPAVVCKQHNRELAFSCSQCNSIKCSVCLRACLEQGHNYTSVVAESDVTVREVRAALQKLSACTDPVVFCRESIQRIESQRRQHFDEVDKNKMALLDHINLCYDKVNSVLDEFYEVLVVNLTEIMSAAEDFKVKVDHSTAYCSSLVDAGDTTSLVDQQKVMLSRLQFLQGEIVKLSASVNIKRKIVLEVQQVKTIKEIVENFIGVPKVVQDGAHPQKEQYIGRRVVILKPEDVPSWAYLP